MASLTDAQKEFLASPYVATLTTLREDGSPHSTIVWHDQDGGTPSFNTAVERAKERHLRRDPRVSLLVVDPNDAYKWVAISGRAELTTDGADGHIDRLAKKYLDQDVYPWHTPEEQRITVHITPELVDSSGFGS